jgi:uncharacterized protein
MDFNFLDTHRGCESKISAFETAFFFPLYELNQGTICSISGIVLLLLQKHTYWHKQKFNKMKNRYMNPYVAGTLLGLVLLAAMFISGRGLGASGGLKYCVVSIVGAVDRTHADKSVFYSKYFEDGKKPLKNWLVLEITGVVLGGFISGALSRRLKFRIEKSPGISNTRRLIFAFLGGVFFVYGAQLARGCTSGAALSGMAVLSVAGFVTMAAIFGSAYMFAWFFRKNWI